MKKLLLALLFLLSIGTICTMRSHANSVELVVALIDGTSQKYDVNEKPVVSFDSEYVYIKSTLIETSIAQSEVERFFFNDYTGVEETENQIAFKYDGNTITINGNEYTTAIYDLSGIVRYSLPTYSGSTTIDISDYVAGIYLVKINKQTIKIIKR